MRTLGTVIFVHGLWMPGFDMALLRWRVKRCGFKVAQFHYSTVFRTPQQSANKLYLYIKSLDTRPVHIVAHSLGGLVVRHLLQQHPEIVAGNIVTLGTPHAGSQLAKLFIRSYLGRCLLGKSIEQGLLGDAPLWKYKNKLGVIAGHGRLGVGRFFKEFTMDSDGTVALDETKIPGMSDHITLVSSHSGLLFKKEVAEQVCLFLKHGHFNR